MPLEHAAAATSASVTNRFDTRKSYHGVGEVLVALPVARWIADGAVWILARVGPAAADPVAGAGTADPCAGALFGGGAGVGDVGDVGAGVVCVVGAGVVGAGTIDPLGSANTTFNIRSSAWKSAYEIRFQLATPGPPPVPR